MLRHGKATEEEIRATKPRYCPNCGTTLSAHGSGTHPTGDVDDPHEWSFSVYWDTYCKPCGWGGDIEPFVDDTGESA